MIGISSTEPRISDDGDGYYLDITIANRIAFVRRTKPWSCHRKGLTRVSLQAISVDSITVSLVGQEQHRLEFTAGPSEISSGDSAVTLFCPVGIKYLVTNNMFPITDRCCAPLQDPASGSFIVEMTEIRMAKLIFQWPHKVPTPKDNIDSTSRYVGPPLVTLPPDRRAFNVQVQFPRESMSLVSRLI